METIRRQGDSLLLLTALSIYPPLFLYVHNIARFPFTVVLEPATVIAVFTLSFWALLSIVSGHPKKTAFILSVNLLLFFSYGAFTTYLLRVHFHIHGCTFGYKKLYVVTCVIINLLLVLITGKRPGIESTGCRVLLITAITVLISTAVSFFTAKEVAHDTAQAKPDKRLEELVGRVRNSGNHLRYPDIYHIILDAHPRSDILRKYFDIDNDDFIETLRKNGFIVPRVSWSNYTCTDLCLPSLLNFIYIHRTLETDAHYRTSMLYRARQLKANPLSMQFLKRLGYTTYLTENGFESTEKQLADHFIEPHEGCRGIFMNEFLYGLVRMTPVRLVMGLSIAKKVSYFEQHRILIRSALDFLTNAHKLKGPKYVFAHIIAPHTPIVFGPQGEEIQQGPKYLNNPCADPEAFLQASRGEILFLDSLMGRVISRMVAADSGCIIILQSDHGEFTVWPQADCPDTMLLRQRHGILNALRIPGHAIRLPDTVTAVNTYPVIFNAVFKTGIPALENEAYFSPISSPFQLCEVSEKLGLPKRAESPAAP